MKIQDVAKTIIIFVGFLLLINVSSLDVNESKLRGSVQDAIWQVVGISQAYAGEKRDKASRENKSACKKWCANNKDKCKKCGKRSCGVGYKHIKTWGGFGTNWYACTLNTYGKESANNKAACEKWCDANTKCVDCKTLKNCGVGYKNLKSWTGRGLNWHACMATHEGEKDICCGGRDLLDCSQPWPTGFIGLPTAVPFWNKEFLDACVRHDYCYLYGAATYGRSRSYCDTQLLSDMKKLCDGRPNCLRVANRIYAGVRLFGGRNFASYHPPPATCKYPDRMTTLVEREKIGACETGMRVADAVPEVPKLTGKWVNIQNEGSGKCLDVAEWSKDDGGNIQQWGCKKDTNQLFQVEINEDGGVYIVNQGSERCLDVTDFSNENGANIQQWGCKKDTNQLFEFIEIKPGWYNIKSLYNDKCLDVTDLSTKDGANIQQWGCKVGGNQSFKLLD